MTLASARLKASVRFPPLRGMYQRGGTCKGCGTSSALNRIKHHQSNPSNVPGILDFNLSKSAVSFRKNP